MYWWILDIIIAVIFIVCFAVNYHKGLLAAALGTVGVVIALFVALWAGEKLTPAVYDGFIKDKIASVAAATGDVTGSTVTDALGDTVGSVVDSVGSAIGSAASNVANSVVDASARSVTKAILSGFIFCLALIVVRALARGLQQTNKIPVLGAANKLLGGAFGLVMGMVWAYVFVSVCAVIIRLTHNELGFLNTAIADQTYLFGAIYPYNILSVIAGL